MSATFPDSDPAAGSPEGAALDDPRLLQVVEEYLTEVNAGRRPDRQLFISRFPELASALGGCLDAVDFVQTAVPQPDGPEPVQTPFAPNVISQLGDFRLLREAGRGGMGIVYEALQVSLGRRVAVKVLPGTAAADPQQLQRFRIEAQAAAQLRHPHIVPIYAVGCEANLHFLAMQLIDGPTLSDIIRALSDAHAPAELPTTVPAGTTTADRVLSDVSRVTATSAARGVVQSLGLARVGERHRVAARLFRDAAAALAHAHDMGVIHRDIKPGNLMVEPSGHLWVADFGLAKLSGSQDLTRTTDVLGTPRYMSPEQARGTGTAFDQRVDVYGLGVTLYELLTRQPAFPGDDRLDLVRRISHEDPVPPRRIDPTIPLDLETILLKSMANEPFERYPTARDMADDLQRFLDDRPIQARRPTVAQRVVRLARRHRTLVLGSLVSAFALLITSVWLLTASNLAIKSEQQATRAALARETAALAREQETAYNHAIALAHREWLAGNVDHARLLLDHCPPPLRRWEWHYLSQLCGTELLPSAIRGKLVAQDMAQDGRIAVSNGRTGVRICALDSGHDLPAWKFATGNIGPADALWLLNDQYLATRQAVVVANPNSIRLNANEIAARNEVWIWNAATGERWRTLQGHQGRILGLTGISDGRRLISASADRTLKIWDCVDGREVRTLRGHQDAVSAVAADRDGRRAVSYSRDGELRIWDTETGQILHRLRDTSFFEQSAGGSVRLAFSPDGSQFAASNTVGNVGIWNAATAGLLLSFPAHDTNLTAIQFTPDGAGIATAARLDRVVKLWDSGNGRLQRALRGRGGDVTGLTFAADGRRLVCSRSDNTTQVWDSSTPQQARFIGAEPPAPRVHGGLAFSHDGRLLATHAWGPRITLWEVGSGAPVEDIQLPPHVNVVQVSFAGDYQCIRWVGTNAAAGDWDRTSGSVVREYRVAPVWPQRSLDLAQLTGQLQLLDPHPDLLTHTRTSSYAARGSRLALASDNTSFEVWDAEAAVRVREFDATPRTGCVAISPDGRRLAVAGEINQSVKILDVDSGRELLALDRKYAHVLDLTFSSDGEQLAVGTASGAIDVLAVATGAVRFQVSTPLQNSMCLSFTPDGQRLAVAVGDVQESSRAIRICECRAGRELLTLPLEAPVDALAFSPNGRHLAALCHDGGVWLFDGTARSAADRLEALEARTLQWHARHAEEQESRKNWFAAAWHL